MSEDQGYITKDQDSSDQGHDFESRDFDRNYAGDADAEGGDNKGDINLNIEQGGDAYARGGDVITHETYEHHSYTEYREPDYDEHGKDEYGKDEYDEECGKHEEFEGHESAENVF